MKILFNNSIASKGIYNPFEAYTPVKAKQEEKVKKVVKKVIFKKKKKLLFNKVVN